MFFDTSGAHAERSRRVERSVARNQTVDFARRSSLDSNPTRALTPALGLRTWVAPKRAPSAELVGDIRQTGKAWRVPKPRIEKTGREQNRTKSLAATRLRRAAETGIDGTARNARPGSVNRTGRFDGANCQKSESAPANEFCAQDELGRTKNHSGGRRAPGGNSARTGVFRCFSKLARFDLGIFPKIGKIPVNLLGCTTSYA